MSGMADAVDTNIPEKFGRSSKNTVVVKHEFLIRLG